MKNKLYYGDNLKVLRDHVGSETVDLVYLDPPFNSNASYNVLFKSPGGEGSPAQIEAFDDTWHWSALAEEAYWEVLHGPSADAARVLESMRGFLGENDMMAYLSMMSVRLIELHRVLKSTGSIYLHCDPTASHYLKILLDAIFSPQGYRNEIIWKRSNPKSHASTNFPTCTDTILRYAKGKVVTFNPVYEAHDPEYVASAYKYTDERGSYRLLPLLNPNDNRPNLTYEFLGVTRVWRWTRERMQAAYEQGLVVQLKHGAVPQYKKYLEDSKGRTITNCWTDIPQAAGREVLGYPTQKPLALLERIIAASSNEGDVVLDPFCGCGTTIHAAQRMGRRWIGIDVTHLAISLIERRLNEAFSGVGLHRLDFETIGVPKDISAAEDLAARNKHEFEKWAITLIPDAQPSGKRGPDSGIDGVLYLQSTKGRSGSERAIIEVKGGTVSVDHVHKLKSVVEREHAAIGLLLTLREPTRSMIAEAATAGFHETSNGVVPKIQVLTIRSLLDGQRAQLPNTDASSFRKAKKESSDGEQGTLGF